MYFDTGEGGGEPERSLEGEQLTKLGRKYQYDWLYFLSINLLTPTAQSIVRSFLDNNS